MMNILQNTNLLIYHEMVEYWVEYNSVAPEKGMQARLDQNEILNLKWVKMHQPNWVDAYFEAQQPLNWFSLIALHRRGGCTVLLFNAVSNR